MVSVPDEDAVWQTTLNRVALCIPSLWSKAMLFIARDLLISWKATPGLLLGHNRNWVPSQRITSDFATKVGHYTLGIISTGSWVRQLQQQFFLQWKSDIWEQVQTAPDNKSKLLEQVAQAPMTTTSVAQTPLIQITPVASWGWQVCKFPTTNQERKNFRSPAGLTQYVCASWKCTTVTLQPLRTVVKDNPPSCLFWNQFILYWEISGLRYE